MSNNTNEESRIAANIGHIFRKRRLQLGLSLDDVGRMTTFEKPTISRVENGQILRPGYFMIFGLTKLYGLSLDDLIGLRETPTPELGDGIHTLVDALIAVATPDQLEVSRTFLKLFLKSIDSGG